MLFFIGHSQTEYPKIDALILKAKLYKETNIDSALFYADKANLLAIKTNDVIAIAHTIIPKSSFLINKSKFKEAEELLQQNLLNKNALNLSKDLLGSTYFNLAIIAHKIGRRDETIKYYFQAVDLFASQNDYRNTARSYLGIGAAFEKVGEKEYSDYFYNKSLEIYKKYNLDNPHDGDMSLVSKTDRIENCLQILKSIKNKDNSLIAIAVYEDLAEAYYDEHQYNNAIVSAKKSIEISKNNHFNLNHDNCRFIMANSYVDIGNYSKARDYYIKILQETSRFLLKTIVLEKLTTVYKGMGDLENALIHSELYNAAKDSVNLLKENERIAEITAQYENEKQEKEILLLKQENQEKELLITQKESNVWKWSLFALLATLIAAFLGRKLLHSLKLIKKVELEKKQLAKKVEEVAVILNNKSKIYLDKLKYIKSDGNYLEFVTDDKIIIDRNKLKDILYELPPNFVRVHRSYVINKNFIDALNSTTLFLKPNIEIPLSRTFKGNIA